MALPDSIPTVRVTGRYLTLNGEPLSGRVVFRAPSIVTFDDADVIMGGPVNADLDASGAFEVILPATDFLGMNPTGWSYSVAEQLATVGQNRNYNILLPAEDPVVDITDIAPTDPLTPNFVAVRGDSAYEVAVKQGFAGTLEQWLASLVGPVGPQGVRGSQVFTGTAAPTAGLGVDGDVYLQMSTTTLLNVPAAQAVVWRKAGGAWASDPNVLRPSTIYARSGATNSDGIPLGDVLIRTDTGDVYQRGASGWGASIGNIKGPKGDTGPQGPKGDPGAGSVNSVNGDFGPDISLDAGDVGAIAKTGTVDGVNVRINGNGSSAPLTVYGNNVDDKRLAVLTSGSIYSNAMSNTMYNLGIGSTTTPFGSGTYVLGIQNAEVLPTGTPGNGVVAYAEAGKLKVRQGDGSVAVLTTVSVNGIMPGALNDIALTAGDVGAVASSARGAANGVASLDSTTRIPVAQMPTSAMKNSWTPQALGFDAWSVDPYAVANPVAKYLVPGRLYLVGINITEPTLVNRIVMFARGYGGVTTNRYRAGIYRENGTGTGSLVVESAGVALNPAGQETGVLPAMATNHIGAVPITVTNTTLQPGRHWVAWCLATGGTADFSFFHVQNESPVATANFFMTDSPWARSWYRSGQANAALPATLNQAASGSLADHDIPIVALAHL